MRLSVPGQVLLGALAFLINAPVVRSAPPSPFDGNWRLLADRSGRGNQYPTEADPVTLLLIKSRGLKVHGRVMRIEPGRTESDKILNGRIVGDQLVFETSLRRVRVSQPMHWLLVLQKNALSGSMAVEGATHPVAFSAVRVPKQ